MASADDYAVEVVEYVAGTINPAQLYDWIDGTAFTNALSATGRPTVDTTGDAVQTWMPGIPVGEVVPVVPVYPAFRAFEVVTIGQGGRLVLKFDHRVLDDPANPYGLDFLVFGNAKMGNAGGAYWTNGPPADTLVSGGADDEEARISVSQDGLTWLRLTAWPTADAFAPTLGHRLEPAPGTGWGPAAEATRPIDPGIDAADLGGWSIEDIARHYRDSAGGTGYDLHALALAPDAVSGWKWIQYVKIEAGPTLTPEVDAVSDVAPATAFHLWQIDQFPWLGDPVHEQPEANPDHDAWPNLLEYALDLDPGVADQPETFLLQPAEPPASGMWLTYTRRVDLAPVSVSVRGTDRLDGSWRDSGIIQEATVTSLGDTLEQVTAHIPASTGYTFFSLQAQP